MWDGCLETLMIKSLSYGQVSITHQSPVYGMDVEQGLVTYVFHIAPLS